MIYIKRSVEFNKDVTWIANDLDEDRRHNRMLYAGSDVNGAIGAAVAAGVPHSQACAEAQAEINRCNKPEHNDLIVGS